MGVSVIDDYNGKEQEGFGVIQLSAADSQRYSTARAYLRNPPESLKVLIKSHVTKVVIEGSRATGVEVVGSDKQRRVIRAGREVILTGGTFGSPHVLMLSGIGHADHLRAHGIDVKADLPVGDNLHDHLYVPVSFRMESAVRRPTPLYFLRGMAQAKLAKKGWATGSQFESSGWVRSSHAGEIPDLQMHVLYWIYPTPNQDADVPVRPPTTRPGLCILPTLIYPESRGTLRLASADPFAAPLIDPAYLREDKDTEVLLDGIKLVREAMAGLGDNEGEVGPGPDYASDAEMRKVLPNYVHSVYHPVGTCRMGTDERAVVDPHLKVLGIDGLRVADASVMPSVVGGNTNAATIMIGERTAELILAGQ